MLCQIAAIIRVLSNLENPIDRIPVFLAGKMCTTDRGICFKGMLLKEPKTEHEEKNLHNDVRKEILTAQK
jgi:hypothetical protein